MNATAWSDLKALPREARDTLFLLAVITWTILPHVTNLPWWCTAITVLMLGWRAMLAVANGPLPGRWVLVGVLAVASGLTYWEFRSLLGKEPGVTMAVTLMALKTLELRARRDAFVVFFLGFFIVLTHFLYSQSIFIAVATLASVWGLLSALVLAHMPVGQPNLKQAGALAARTALLGAPVMALLFVLFPRIGPLWGVPDAALSSTGLSNTMRLGTVAEIAQDDRIAMRIRFLGRVPPPQAMYFRGPVLSRYDGLEWRQIPFDDPVRTGLQTRGEPYRYEVTLEPLMLRVLPLLEAAREAPTIEGHIVAGRRDLQWLTGRPIVERLRFEAEAYLQFEHGPLQRQQALDEHRLLPDTFNPRLVTWARSLQASMPDANSGRLAQAVMQHIRENGYGYTLSPGTYGDTDPRAALDEFWLDRKLGFCEHYAAGFVVAMRAMGVPARIVTGFQGTDENPIDGYYIVRQSAAHAWAEYWQAGRGWLRADPTAAVSPDRIDRSRRLSPEPGFVAGALNGMSPQLFARWREMMETLNNRWNQWVLGYSKTQQFDLLKSLGYSAPSWEDLATALIAVLSSGALAGALWAWWDRRRVDPWTRQMNALRSALRRLGLAAAAHETPRALATRLREAFGDASAGLIDLLESLERQRYARDAIRKPDRRLTRAFVTQARQLKIAQR